MATNGKTTVLPPCDLKLGDISGLNVLYIHLGNFLLEMYSGPFSLNLEGLSYCYT